VEARCRAGFREHGGAGEAMTPYDIRSGTVLQNVAAGAVVTIPTAAASMLPGSGAAKDKAQGSLAFKYTVVRRDQDHGCRQLWLRHGGNQHR
jgi:hypothetical protein